MRLGLVGFPQSGRTTVFTALTGAVATEARPDRTQVATLRVPDPRLERLRDIHSSKKIVYTSIEIEDLPPLPPPGAPHLAEGAQVLAAMRLCDALILVVRAFPGDTVPYHRDRLDPLRDLADLEAELLFSDLDIAARRLERVRKSLTKPLPNKDALEVELGILERCVARLEKGQGVDPAEFKAAELKVMGSFQFLSQKPRMVAFNVGEAGARQADAALAAIPKSLQIAAALERDIAGLDPADRPAFMGEYNLSELVAPRLVRLAYDVLDVITFYTAAENEARAWTLRRGATAVEAAGEIHTDLARGFIRAEVVAYADIDAAGAFKEAKARGQVRLEGRDYVVQDADMVLIRFSA